MKIELFFTGKTTESFLKAGIDEYLKRLKHYVQVTEVLIEPARLSKPDFKKAAEMESGRMLDKIKAGDFVILLDERGKSLGSEELAAFIGKHLQTGISKLIFVTGGAYGVSDSMKQRANLILSFSKFTFTHQMIRVLLVEQIYRAMTILKNEKYHH